MSEMIHLICPSCHGVNRIPAARLGDSPNCGKCRSPLTDSSPLEVNAAEFNKFVQRSDIPLLVDFWAPWCGPCKMMAPMFAAAAEQLAPSVRLLKVNTEENQQLGAQLGIRSIPTLALFKGGKEVARQPGAMESVQIVAWTRQNLAR
jgi:thioredoxin 2